MLNEQLFLLQPNLASCPPEKLFVWVYSKEVPGLYLEVKPSGRRSWFGYFKTNGKRSRKKLGDAVKMSYSQAKAAYIKLAGVKNADIKPSYSLIDLTIEDGFLKYYQIHVALECARPAEVIAAYNRYWTGLKQTQITALNPTLVGEWMAKTATSFGKETANKQFTLLKACVNFLVDRNYVELGKDPFKGLKRFKSQPEERYLHKGAQYNALMAALDKAPGAPSDAIKLCLFTGQRKKNVLSMHWRDINLSAGTWIVPGRESKTRKPIVVALSSKALTVLEAQPSRKGYVFGSDRAKSGHVENIDEFWRKTREDLGLGLLKIHDLRHTFGTWLGQGGANAFVIQQALGHANIATTKRYVHLNVKEVLSEIERSQE